MYEKIKFTFVAFTIFGVDFILSESTPFLYLVTDPPPSYKYDDSRYGASMFLYLKEDISPPDLHLITNSASFEKLREMNQESNEKGMDPDHTPHLYLVTTEGPPPESQYFEMDPVELTSADKRSLQDDFGSAFYDKYIKDMDDPTCLASIERYRQKYLASDGEGKNPDHYPHLYLITPEGLPNSKHVENMDTVELTLVEKRSLKDDSGSAFNDGHIKDMDDNEEEKDEE